jgi:hypothetical protein
LLALRRQVEEEEFLWVEAQRHPTESRAQVWGR